MRSGTELSASYCAAPAQPGGGIPRFCENLPGNYLTPGSVGGDKLFYRFPILGKVDNVVMRGAGDLQVDGARLPKAFA